MAFKNKDVGFLFTLDWILRNLKREMREKLIVEE